MMVCMCIGKGKLFFDLQYVYGLIYRDAIDFKRSGRLVLTFNVRHVQRYTTKNFDVTP